MFLDSGRAIAEKIQALIDGEVAEPVRFAVAFWGNGADYQLRGPCKILCDLESGACNPKVIRALCKRDNSVVLKLSGLHAKVVIGSSGAVVSSANMSSNGLGAEGADASGTIEAGYFISARLSDYEKIVSWFETLWSQATEITELDFAKAQEKWEFRNQETYSTPTTQPVIDTSTVEIDPWSLVEEAVNTKHRLRAVKPNILKRLRTSLPDVDHRRLGKIASWTCHLLLNRSGMVLEHSAGDGEELGPATDDWIVGRFGKEKKNETVNCVVTLLQAIRLDPSFTEGVRRASNQVLSAPPWIDPDLSAHQD